MLRKIKFVIEKYAPYNDTKIIDLFDVIQSLQYLDEGVNREFKGEESISFLTVL